MSAAAATALSWLAADDISRVETGLYLSGLVGRQYVEALAIDVVVSFAAARERDLLVLPAHVVEHSYAVPDSALLPAAEVHAFLDSAVRQVREARAAGKTVLVHCAAGVSRSPSVVLDYLMARDGTPFEAALADLQRVRPCVQPNALFRRVLKERVVVTVSVNTDA